MSMKNNPSWRKKIDTKTYLDYLRNAAERQGGEYKILLAKIENKKQKKHWRERKMREEFEEG